MLAWRARWPRRASPRAWRPGPEPGPARDRAKHAACCAVLSSPPPEGGAATTKREICYPGLLHEGAALRAAGGLGQLAARVVPGLLLVIGGGLHRVHIGLQGLHPIVQARHLVLEGLH